MFKSHISKLIFGLEIEGITNGNMATPQVNIIPAIVIDEKKMQILNGWLLEAVIFNNAPPTANAGRINITGASKYP